MESADLGSVLLCPWQRRANPHLQGAAEASSPRPEIGAPVSKRAPAQQIRVSLPCPPPTLALRGAARAAAGSL